MGTKNITLPENCIPEPHTHTHFLSVFIYINESSHCIARRIITKVFGK